MARAKRHYIPGHVWHITHRCHKREFLLKFPRDRRRWIEWLYQAKKRYGVSVLNYMVTSNHVHLLVFDDGRPNVISDSIKLVAGRTGQEYNMRKNRMGAFWQDRYHATAVESNRHLRQCITYIDMNMFRAGVVKHPAQWEFCGYYEIQKPKKRKGIIDFERLMDLLGFKKYDDLKEAHKQWVEMAVQTGDRDRESKWTQSIAVGSKAFIEKLKQSLGFKAKGRKIIDGVDDTFELREVLPSYGRPDDPDSGNSYLWNPKPPALRGRFLCKN
jgi:putative transposase